MGGGQRETDQHVPMALGHSTPEHGLLDAMLSVTPMFQPRPKLVVKHDILIPLVLRPHV